MLKSEGIAPKIREQFELRDKAMAGNFVFAVTALDDAPVASASGFTAIRVRIEALVTAGGDRHTWFNKTITTTALAVVTDGDGTAVQAPATSCVMENGVGIVTVTGSATWAADDTFAVETAEATILGYTIAEASATVTCVAAA